MTSMRSEIGKITLDKTFEEREALNAAMGWHMHCVGRGDIAAFAISALDIALWDLRGKSRGAALWRMASLASDVARLKAATQQTGSAG